MNECRHTFLFFCLIKISHPAECLKAKYERMIASYYRSQNLTASQPCRAPISCHTDNYGVSTWRLEWDSNQQPPALKASNTTTEPPHHYSICNFSFDILAYCSICPDAWRNWHAVPSTILL